MKVFMLSLVMLIGVSFASNAEQNEVQVVNSVNCDQQAKEVYNNALAEGATQNEATSMYVDEFWGCWNDGGMAHLEMGL